MHAHNEVRGLRRAELITTGLPVSAEFYAALLSWRALRSATGFECWVGERQCASMRSPRSDENQGWRLLLAGAAHNCTLTGPDEASAELVTGRAQHGPWAPAPRAGEPCWIELFTSTAERADAFWAELLKWTVEGGADAVYTSCGRPIAGRTECPRGCGWLCYYAVADLDAAADRVTELGGRVLGSARHKLLDEVLVIADPNGAITGLARERGGWGM